jgi:hypothetical protein
MSIRYIMIELFMAEMNDRGYTCSVPYNMGSTHIECKKMKHKWKRNVSRQAHFHENCAYGRPRAGKCRVLYADPECVTKLADAVEEAFKTHER